MEKKLFIKKIGERDEEALYSLSREMEHICSSLLEISHFFAFNASRIKDKPEYNSIGFIRGGEKSLLFVFKETTGNIYIDIFTPSKKEISWTLQKYFEKIDQSFSEEQKIKSVFLPKENTEENNELILSGDFCCKNCKKSIKPGSKFCRYCGVSQELEESRACLLICNKCGCENISEANFCKKCGGIIEHTGEKACPGCGKSLKADSHFCRYCRYDFQKETLLK